MENEFIKENREDRTYVRWKGRVSRWSIENLNYEEIEYSTVYHLNV